MRLYVGNLPFHVDDDALRAAFTPYGTVSSATVIIDRSTGHSRGFGFVEMSNDAEAQAAMRALDGSSFEGRPLTVNEAKERTSGGGGGGYGGLERRGGGGGGGRRGW